MQVDKTTLNDISIFHSDETQSVFYWLNHTTTNGGREHLKHILSNPLDNIAAIDDTQKTILHLMKVHRQLPQTITNGTIMVIESFFETATDAYPTHPNIWNSMVYKVLSAPDFSITKYSVTHFIGFIKDLLKIAEILSENNDSNLVGQWCEVINKTLRQPVLETILSWPSDKKVSNNEILWLGAYLKLHYKKQTLELIHLYNKLDAYLSMATTSEEHKLTFPKFNNSTDPLIKAQGLYHLLLQVPVSYDLLLDKSTNFMFLTGANMAGKSTFIKSIGTSIYLAHLGMGVPANKMELSLFDGLLTNIQVEDNLMRGESYFYNEVKRISRTVEKISDGRRWLILIDELFKGTNVQDAMKCSIAVIEGLHKMNNALFILSTHLYEIAEPLRKYPNIDFRFFETSVQNDQLVFSYQLQNGVSNDRLGYLILKREGVVKMLENLS
jgi:DNA mismatch repair ATPase MutS